MSTRYLIAFLLILSLGLSLILTGCSGGGARRGTASVTGQIIDGVSDQPVGAATVSIGDISVTTTDGRFALTGVPTGSQWLVIESSGYNTRSIPIVVNFGANNLGDVALYDATTGSVSGRVLSATTGLPLTTATATIGSNTENCSAGGQFSHQGIAAGPVTVVLAAPGYIAQSVTTNVTAGRNTDIGDIPLAVDQGTDVPTGPRTIEGTITLQGQSDHSGVQVTLVGADISYSASLTASNGAYAIWAPAGTYTLRASKAGYVTKEQSVTITIDPILQVNMTLTPG